MSEGRQVSGSLAARIRNEVRYCPCQYNHPKPGRAAFANWVMVKGVAAMSDNEPCDKALPPMSIARRNDDVRMSGGGDTVSVAGPAMISRDPVDKVSCRV